MIFFVGKGAVVDGQVCPRAACWTFLADRGNGAPSCRALQVGLTEAPVWEPSAAMRRSPYLGIGAVRLGQADSKRAFSERGKA